MNNSPNASCTIDSESDVPPRGDADVVGRIGQDGFAEGEEGAGEEESSEERGRDEVSGTLHSVIDLRLTRMISEGEGVSALGLALRRTTMAKRQKTSPLGWRIMGRMKRWRLMGIMEGRRRVRERQLPGRAGRGLARGIRQRYVVATSLLQILLKTAICRRTSDEIRRL